MYVINPEIHMSCLEMAEKSPFLSRLDAPDCVGKVLDFSMFKIKKSDRKYASKTQESGLLGKHLIFVTGTTPVPECESLLFNMKKNIFFFFGHLFVTLFR